MISTPVLKRVLVNRYGLYPGTPTSPGLDAHFQPGLNLVIGANGLGKSTLIQLMYRTLTGAADVGGGSGAQLGSGQLSTRDIPSGERRAFADRVHDAAKDAECHVEFQLGGTILSLTRRIRDLQIVQLTVGSESFEPSEDEYRTQVLRAGGFSEYLDWLLILRYLIFYFDDRRSLVWDPTAQRRVLAMLFSHSNQVEPDAELLKNILSTDSYVRNLSATISRQEKILRQQERAVANLPTIEAEIGNLAQERAALQDESESLNTQLVTADDSRSSARLRHLRDSEEHESALRELEHIRMRHTALAFPSHAETANYILAQLIATGNCLTCGSAAESTAEELRLRIDRGNCVVCKSDLGQSLTEATASSTDLTTARNRLTRAIESTESSYEIRQETEEEYRRITSRRTEIQGRLAHIEVSLSRLNGQLPEASKSMRKSRAALDEMRLQMTSMREQVVSDKQRYAELVDQENNLAISVRKDDIKAAFEHHARDFLLEDCALVWSTHAEPIGQLGRPVNFSVFQIDMTGSDTTTATRRDAAGQVSESQREFIDLAFRMALITVGASNSCGTLIMDAPESSLDAVFAPRAARVLANFGKVSKDSRIIITSNLVDGRLIPMIVELAGISGPDDPRVINLFDIAAPTAALRQLRTEYDGALTRAFGGQGG